MTVSVDWMCGFFDKSRQAYYQIRHRKDKVAVEHTVIIDYVNVLRQKMPKVGTRKLHIMMQEQLKATGINCGRDKLFSILGTADMLQRPHRANQCHTRSLPLSRHFPNLIKDMVLDEPEQAWVSDTTGLPVRDGLGYLTLTTDSYSKRIMGYNAQRTKKCNGAITTLKMALSQRCYPDRQLIHHSDGGGEYFNHEFLKTLLVAHVKASCTAPSSPQENPVAERINGILKNELLLVEDNRTFEEVLKKLPEAIRIYNELRPHASIDYLTPEKAHQCSGPLRKRWKRYAKHRKPSTPTALDGKRIKQRMDEWSCTEIQNIKQKSVNIF
jgi:transposase InsO family protein